MYCGFLAPSRQHERLWLASSARAILCIPTVSHYIPLFFSCLKLSQVWNLMKSTNWAKPRIWKVNCAKLNKHKEGKNYNPREVPIHKYAFWKSRRCEGSLKVQTLQKGLLKSSPACLLWGGRKTLELQVRSSQFCHSESGSPMVKHHFTTGELGEISRSYYGDGFPNHVPLSTLYFRERSKRVEEKWKKIEGKARLFTLHE